MRAGEQPVIRMPRLSADDLGAAVQLPAGPVHRVVSLVPSLTEAIATSAPGVLVGATQWCIRPRELEVTRVRGTKNPDLAAVEALHPDLVICNQEENRRIDVERMRERGLNVWVSVIDSLEQAFAAMRRIFSECLLIADPDWLTEAERVWSLPPTLRGTVALPIWRDPWMVVGGGTYGNDLLGRLGLTNAFAGLPRYPRVDLRELRAAAELVILPDEPYAFSASDGPECFRRSVLVDGRATAWYGPTMVWARGHLEERLGEALA